MTLQQANAWLSKTSPQYYIIGYRPDGRRGKPPVYEEVTFFAKDEQDIVNLTGGLTSFRVFEAGIESYCMEYWRERAKNLAKQKVEQDERALLAELKKKYE